MKIPGLHTIKNMGPDAWDVLESSFEYFKLYLCLVLKESVVVTGFNLQTAIVRNQTQNSFDRLLVCWTQIVQTEKQNIASDFDSYAGHLLGFSGYESALGIWFVVEKINWWFSQQGFSWHQWTCWLSSGCFSVVLEFLGFVYSRHGDSIATCRSIPQPAACKSDTAVHRMGKAVCPLWWLPCPYQPNHSRHSHFVPRLCCRHIPPHAMLLQLLLHPCGSWGQAMWRTDNPSAAGLPAAHRLRYVQPCFQTCFSQNGLGWLRQEGFTWWGCFWRESHGCRCALREQLRGAECLPVPAGWYTVWAQHGACSAPPATDSAEDRAGQSISERYQSHCSEISSEIGRETLSPGPQVCTRRGRSLRRCGRCLLSQSSAPWFILLLSEVVKSLDFWKFPKFLRLLWVFSGSCCLAWMQPFIPAWCWLPSPESVTRQRKHAEHLGCSEAIIPCLQLLAGKALRHAQPGWERFLSSGMERWGGCSCGVSRAPDARFCSSGFSPPYFLADTAELMVWVCYLLAA